jgi:membrane protein
MCKDEGRAMTTRPTRAQIWALLKDIADEWSKDNVARLAAALSFYALLSIAPLLLFTVFSLGLLFGEDSARTKVVDAISSYVGPQAMETIQTLAANAHASQHGALSSIIGAAVALFGASGAFVELQAALNTIWEVPLRRGAAIRSYAVNRFWSFVMVLAVSILLLISLIISAVVAFVGEFFEQVLPGGREVWQLINVASSLGVLTGVFSVMFRSLPETAIKWSDVWIGSFVTALLFVLGNLLLGVYLGKTGVTSMFGGAGSVVALVIWVYYSSQIVFLGAEVTEVYSRHFGSRQPAASGSKNPSPRPSAGAGPRSTSGALGRQ